MIIKNCKNCDKNFKVIKARENTAVYCSKNCMALGYKGRYSKKVKAVCTNCNKDYEVKQSHLTRTSYCSKQCQAIHYKKRYGGDNNPNYRGKGVDYDNYPTCVIKVGDGFSKSMSLHRLVALETLGVNKLPKGFHVHHRDCDITNNTAENLALLSISDHKWLHKNFGNATLWAFINNKITLNEVCSWVLDSERAKKLLQLNLYNQIGIVKDCELLENP